MRPQSRRTLLLALLIPSLGVSAGPSFEPVTVNGECKDAPKLDSPERYRLRLRLGQKDLDFVRVRRNASFNATDEENVLGTLPRGSVVWARGPLKNPDLGNAVGYGIAVRDRLGNLCQGYVSRTVVEEVQRAGPN